MAVNVYREVASGLQLVGVLDGGRRDDASFRYEEEYLASPDARAISLSLPLRRGAYGPKETMPYFDGLLPEGPSRTKLAAELGCREEDYPALLARCGLDCIGDAIIDPEAFLERRAYEPTTLEDVAARSLHARGVAGMQKTSRLSIAGVQSKTGLFHDDSAAIGERWFVPVGGAPSNYIVKFANEELHDLIELEYLCLAAARACGIEAAFAELLFPERPLLCVKRFDRLGNSESLVSGLRAPERRHQEDLAQAFGISSGSKYAELEPSTAHAIANLLVDRSAAPALDIASFARISLFNYVIGNCDNHLKNFSLLYSRDWSTVRLAPAYDLTSTARYAGFSTEMGMRLGSARDINEVAPSDIIAFAQQIGIAQSAIRRMASEISAEVVRAFEVAASHLSENGFVDALYLFDELEEELAPRLEVLERV